LAFMRSLREEEGRKEGREGGREGGTYPMLWAIFPSSVFIPVAVTMARARPRPTTQPKNAIFLRSPTPRATRQGGREGGKTGVRYRRNEEKGREGGVCGLLSCTHHPSLFQLRGQSDRCCCVYGSREIPFSCSLPSFLRSLPPSFPPSLPSSSIPGVYWPHHLAHGHTLACE